MKPLGMDKNRVLIYEGDIVLYNGSEYKAYESELTSNLLLIPYIKELGVIQAGTIGWTGAAPGAVEVVNVSDRTNYERYFADLCSRGVMYDYLCCVSLCDECVVNETICVNDRTFTLWLDEPAVKL